MLGIRRVVVPRTASVLSAWGMLTTELRLEAVQTSVGETDTLDISTLRALYARMDDEGRARMSTWFDGEIEHRHFAEMRYGEQVFEIDVPLAGIDFATADDSTIVMQLKQAFEKRHDELYAYCLPEQHPVLINARVATVGLLPELAAERVPPSDAPARAIATRDIYLADWTPADVYRFGDLIPEQVVEGPAVIESDSTTVLLRPGDRAETTPQRWLDISVAG
jgi:N-methylhydantoinase A